jgi:hypothetical protein
MKSFIGIPAFLSITATTSAFAPMTPFVSKTVATRMQTPLPTLQMATATSSPPDTLRDEINSMYIKDIRTELESYGVDCSSIFEKKELVDELVNARRSDWMRREFDVDDTAETIDGEKYASVVENAGWENEQSSSSSDNYSSDTSKDKSWFKQGLEDMANKFNSTLKDKVRSKRIELEISNLQDAKVKDLKEELESYGISAKSFFEKSAFIKAVAEARVDGVAKTNKKSAASSSDRSRNNDGWDPSYKDVSVRRFDARTMDMSGLIDIRAR